MYTLPPTDAPLDQGDLIDGCPILNVAGFPPDQPENLEVHQSLHRVVVLAQTCDLANDKRTWVAVAPVYEAVDLVERGLLKPADIRGPLRAGRVFGWYFLPRSEDPALPESIVDLRQLHTVTRGVLSVLCRQGKRIAHIGPLYREHLAQHFAITCSRIGLPAPCETE